MAYDYALVHIKYTIPLAIVLTSVYRPLFTRLDVYKILFLITVAVISTTPWDSYLIRNKIWTYPVDAIVGPTLFDIPAEEIFFFLIQTYNTSLLYLFLSKPTFHSVYLKGKGQNGFAASAWLRFAGQAVLVLLILCGWKLFQHGGEGTYMGLILLWALPFVLLLWTVAYQFIWGLPFSNTIWPIVLPTLYLWFVDTLALRRGTWVIESGTKLNITLWEGLEIEEAVFFLITNILIVFGLIAFDNALAVLETFPSMFARVPASPSPILLVQALLIPISSYDESRIEGLCQAVERLRKKSRSFYLASGAFQGRLRIDMINLYSFCRVADDMVDNAATIKEAKHWVNQLRIFIDKAYAPERMTEEAAFQDFVASRFPASAQAALLLLPTSYLSSQPLYDLLEGFETDLEFSFKVASSPNAWPIMSDSDLELYANRVAGTVAELCLELVFYHASARPTVLECQKLIRAGGRMGVALQYVNIARDIAVDACIGRVYIPTIWLAEESLTPEDIIKEPTGKRTEAFRSRLLDKAMSLYREARGSIEELPSEAKGPIRVAVESYLEIGRVLQENNFQVRAGRATVPKLRRMRVAWRALNCS
ncbi:MAG: hypothetical protein M1819_002302 [Sarea resinae]|nr:MAG: hypothetical protein M1819_002302 [Sarea resinae]